MLKNPLSLEERTEVTRLIKHDLQGTPGLMYLCLAPLIRSNEMKSDEEIQQATAEFNAYSAFLHKSMDSIKILAGSKVIRCNWEIKEILNPLRDYSRAEFLRDYPEKELSIHIDEELNEETIRTTGTVLYTTLIQFLKNGFRFAKKSIGLNVYRQESSVVENLVFASEDSPKEGEFIIFEVHDDGQGFPYEAPLKDFLDLGFSQGEYVPEGPESKGFGLHFVKLASKYLRAPIAIKSEPGNTHVQLWHPTNLDEL